MESWGAGRGGVLLTGIWELAGIVRMGMCMFGIYYEGKLGSSKVRLCVMKSALVKRIVGGVLLMSARGLIRRDELAERDTVSGALTGLFDVFKNIVM